MNYMQLLDHHMHSNLSLDGHSTLEGIMEDTMARGKQYVVTTDHMELIYEEKGFFCTDMNEYRNQIDVLRKKYPQFTILRGMELGFEKSVAPRIQEFIDDEQFDVTIISIHTLFGGKDIAEELAKHDGVWIHGDDVFSDVLDATIDALTTMNGFTSIGHIDYAWRYMKIKPTSLERYYKQLDRIFELMIEKEIAIDLNTAGWRYGLPFAHPQPAILQRYFEAGGRLIALGSDAHYIKDINADFERALSVLQLIGFTQIAEYRPERVMLDIDSIQI